MDKAIKIIMWTIIILLIFSFWIILTINRLEKDGYVRKQQNLCKINFSNLSINLSIINETNQLLEDETKRILQGYYESEGKRVSNKTI